METFAPDWLSLREHYDGAARSARLARAFLSALPPMPRLVDLGAGTGANARYLEGLGSAQPTWILADSDTALLRRARGIAGPAVLWTLDLAADLPQLDRMHLDGITAAALCDLVSAIWFEDLARLASRRGLPLLLALSLDGRIAWRPADEADALVTDLFRADLRRDKGFGEAFGATAPPRMTEALERLGYRVLAEPSSWRLGARDADMLRWMVHWCSGAAWRQMETARCAAEGWADRRRAQIAAGRLELEIGHADLLALPGPAMRPSPLRETA